MDWAHKEKKIFVVNENLNVVKDFNPSADDTLLLETGFPKAKFLDISTNIFSIPGKVVKQFNENNRIEKSDLEDAKSIMKLWLEDSAQFKKFTERDIFEKKILQQFKIYEVLTKDIARMKNINFAFENEYGSPSEHYKNAIKELELEKKSILKKIEPFFKEEVKSVSDIKGLGSRYLIGILLYAHPRKFPNITSFLRYAGYRNEVFWTPEGKRAGNYNHNVKMMLNQVVDGIIMASGTKSRKEEDKKWYNLYLEIKKSFSDKNPEWSKGKCDGKSKCRVATLIAKEIYHRFNDSEKQSLKNRTDFYCQNWDEQT